MVRWGTTAAVVRSDPRRDAARSQDGVGDPNVPRFSAGTARPRFAQPGCGDPGFGRRRAGYSSSRANIQSDGARREAMVGKGDWRTSRTASEPVLGRCCGRGWLAYGCRDDQLRTVAMFRLNGAVLSGSPKNAEFDAALRRVGVIPRIILPILALPFILVAFVGASHSPPVIGQVLPVFVPLFAVALTWRIRVRVSEEELEVRSYFRRVNIPLSEIVAVDDVGYSGFLNRYNYSPDDWRGFGMRMIEVERRGRRPKPFPATLCGRKAARTLATELTRRAQQAARHGDFGPE